MLVEDLIEELKKYPPKMTVVARDEFDYWAEVIELDVAPILHGRWNTVSDKAEKCLAIWGN